MKQSYVLLLLLFILPMTAMNQPNKKRKHNSSISINAKRVKLNDYKEKKPSYTKASKNKSNIPSLQTLCVQTIAHNIEKYELPITKEKSISLDQVDASTLDAYYESLKENIFSLLNTSDIKHFKKILRKKYPRINCVSRCLLHNEQVTTMTVTKDVTIFFGSNNGNIYKSRQSDLYPSYYLDTPAPITSITLSKDEKTLHAANLDGRIYSLNLENEMGFIRARSTNHKNINSLVLDSSGKLQNKKAYSLEWKLDDGSWLFLRTGKILSRSYHSFAYALCRYALFNSKNNPELIKQLSTTKTFEQTTEIDKKDLNTRIRVKCIMIKTSINSQVQL